jgi:hypothetical protein
MAATTTPAPQMGAVDFYGRISFAGAMYVRVNTSRSSRTRSNLFLGAALSRMEPQRPSTCKLFVI